MSPGISPSPNVHFHHRLLRARDWQDRPEFEQLLDWWREGGRGVCALVGMGGAGKTAIADRFLRVLPGATEPESDPPKADVAEPGALFVFSFYDAPNPDSFFAELAAWLSGEPAEDLTKIPSYQQTLGLLQRAGGCLLVLDGLEKVQETRAAGGAFGRIEDGRLRDFVLRVADGLVPGVGVIITSRFRLFDPEAEGSPLYRQIRVDKLSNETAIDLLRQRGVKRGTDDELRAIARDEGFHALSVDLVGGYIARFCGGDPKRMAPRPLDRPAAGEEDSLDPELAAIREQEHKFSRLAERYRDALSKDDPAALALLQRVCLFRLGIDAATLASIFTGEGKEKISGEALSRLNESIVRAKLELLSEMKLLERSERVVAAEEGASDSTIEVYTVHPAVGEGFLRGLDDEGARQGHDAASEGLTASLGDRPGENPSDPAILDRLEEIVHHTLAAGHAQEAFDIYLNRIGGGRNLVWRLGAYERGERICRAFAGGRPPSEAPLPKGLSENAQAAFINEWAVYLKNLGRLDAAARCYERQIEIRIRAESWASASIGNQNVANVWMLAGRLKKALRAAEEALRFAERAQNSEYRCHSHFYRAYGRALRGESDTALADFSDALKFQREAEGNPERPLYSDRGIQYTLLLTGLGRSSDAVRLTEANKEILRVAWGEQDNDVPKCNLILADLARERGDLGAARGLLEEAHEWAIARDAKETLCEAAWVKGRIELSVIGDRPSAEEQDGKREERLRAARESLEEGLRIARDCGFGIFHIDLLLERARAALLSGDPDSAERDVLLALEEGVHPSADSGLLELLAATDAECGYAWGIAHGLHLRGEAQLLKAAQQLGSDAFVPAKRKELPAEVKNLINEARQNLEAAMECWQPLHDPEPERPDQNFKLDGKEYNFRAGDTSKVLADLNGGVLTRYPLAPADSSQEKRGKSMDIVTDPHLRGDRLWLALDRATIAVREDRQILTSKKHEWDRGLNILEINKLAEKADLSPRPVFETDDVVEGGVLRERVLKVHHPEIDDPVELTTWKKYGTTNITDAKMDRMFAYLEAWQQKREAQISEELKIREHGRTPIRDFNRKRLEELEEIRELQYKKLHKLRKELVLADGPNAKITMEMRIEEQLIPSLRQTEHEYAELLAAAPGSVPEAEAEPIVVELVEAVDALEQAKSDEVPADILQALHEIREKLDSPGKTAAAKLKLSIPIVPLLASYDLELDTENLMTGVWRKLRGVFKRAGEGV